MTAYQQCPFCERVFAIGREEHEPMKRHLGFAHRESTGSSRRTPNGNDDGIRRRHSPAD